MKLLLFSDLHLDAAFRWARPPVARRRRQALVDTLSAIIDLAIEEAADAILCGGDLYEHDRFGATTGEILRRAFERVHPTPVFISPGNHDWFGAGSLYVQTAWSPNVHIFAEPQLQPVTLATGVTLWGAAHRSATVTPGFLTNFSCNRQDLNLALFHGSESRAFRFEEEGKSPHAPFDAEAIRAKGLHHAFLGHYHRPHDEALFTYPGNPDPLTFGETGDRGVVIVTLLEDGTLLRTRRRVARSNVHDVTVAVTGCGTLEDVRHRVRAAVDGLRGCARVTLTGDLAAEIDLHASDFDACGEALDALVVRLIGVRVAYDVESISREHTVRGQFVRDVLQSPALDEEERWRVVATGLRGFDGRMDLEVP
jgi:DNA repair exonuclease SbcCD nuclease subunit